MIVEVMIDGIVVIVTEIEEMEVGTETIHDFLIESEGTTIAGIIIAEAAKDPTTTEMLIGTEKQIAIVVDVMKIWTDREDPSPDLDLRDEEEVTEFLFTFVLDGSL
jgi:hypothetical protein